MTVAQKRAPKGGAYGVNGEWYEGGKFIATVNNPKRHTISKKAGGKVEIAPYEWIKRADLPEGFSTIYKPVSTYIDWNEYRKNETVQADKSALQGLRNMYGDSAEKEIDKINTLIEAYTKGHRFYQQSDNGYIFQ